MKKIYFLILFIFVLFNIQAQNYQISFTGSGVSTTVDSVHVINLTKCTSVSLSGSDTLFLTISAGINPVLKNSSGLTIYPNPTTSSCKLEFFNTRAGSTSIEVFELNGRKIIYETQELSGGLHIYSISGLSTGVYYIKVNTPDQIYISQIVSMNDAPPANVSIKYEGGNSTSTHQMTLKSINSIIQMQYNDGEQLLFEGFSGYYPYVIKTLTPTTSQTINFDFVATALTGATPVCKGDNGMAYSIAYVPGVTYTWTYSGTGFTVASGQGTNSITGNFSAAATPGILFCTPSNACGNTPIYVMNVAISNAPTGVSASASPDPVCTGGTLTLTSNASGVTSWSWTGPNGFTSALQNPTITNFTTADAGVYSLTASNANCAAATVNTSAVTVNTTLAQPSTITGNTTVCQNNNDVTYTVTNVTGATYAWSYSGTGFTIVSGQGTNSITVNYSASATSGTLTCTPFNACGNGTAQNIDIIVNTVPSGAISSITGNSAVCQSNNGVAYSVTNVSGITYTWTYSGNGFTVASGQGTNTITANFSASATSGTLTCTASNACGNGSTQTKGITVNNSPAGVTASASPNPVCAGNTLTLTGTGTGATAWSWTGPNNFTSSSQNPTITNITSAGAGVYTLTASNGSCSATPVSTSTVAVSAAIAQPSAITGNAAICQGNNGIAYSVTNVSGITYTWTYSGSGFTVASGQGTNAVTVNYSPSATSGTLTCTPSNGCGNGTAQTKAITANNSPTVVTATASPNPVCTGNTLTLTGGATGATTWSWTGPNGFTSSIQNPTITNITAAGAGIYSLIASNGSCSAAAVNTTTVTVNASIAQAGSISGTSAICQGNNGVAFSVPAITGATGYMWQYTGTGFTIATGSNTNAITANFSGSATSGSLTVYGTCSCGNGAASPAYALSLSTAPATPGTITGNTSVCTGAIENYSIAPVSGATSYTWTLPSGATYTGASLNTTATYASTCVNQTAIGTVAWTTPANATANDATYATVALSNNAQSNYLVATGFGFNIPSGATITGIIVEWEKKASSTSTNNKDNAIRIVKNGTIGTTDKSNTTAWGNVSDVYTSYGSSTDLWGETWTAADINASTFGAVLSVKRTSTTSNTLSVDAVRITVYYNSTTSITVTFGSVIGNISVTANNASCSSGPSTIVITGGTPPSAPIAGTHTPSATQIIWNWNTVVGATGYKYNTVNNYATATNNGTSTSYTQSGLVCNTGYTLYVWAYDACNNSTALTLSQSTSVCPPFACGTGSVSDIDGNTYSTVSIGTQCWMGENLNTGTRIDLLVDQSNNGVIEKYCYDNLVANCTTYGGLYQWNELMQYVTTAGATGICPTGWHVPTDAEWATLVGNFTASTAGTALKQGGSSGFDALMGGRRDADGAAYQISLGAYFWTSSLNSANAWYRFISSTGTDVTSSSNQKVYGFSLRCLKSN